MSNLTNTYAHITGYINNSPLEATVNGLADLSTGIIEAELNVMVLPDDFAVLAASGVSWLCWRNTDIASLLSPEAINLNQLTNGNYDLARCNKFPDGSAINMEFEVRRKSNDRVEAIGEWNGTYSLSTEIVGIESPIYEEMRKFSDGTIESHYQYTLRGGGGQKFVVETPSTYSFKSVHKELASLRKPQRRIMTFAIEEQVPNQKYRLQSNSSIDIISDYSPLHLTPGKEDFGVVVKV